MGERAIAHVLAGSDVRHDVGDGYPLSVQLVPDVMFGSSVYLGIAVKSPGPGRRQCLLPSKVI